MRWTGDQTGNGHGKATAWASSWQVLLGEPHRPSKLEKSFAADLMHQQCWCWGRDVGGAENLLLRFGFKRHRRPGAEEASGAGGTRYEYTGEDGVRVALWGFGMWLRLPSGAQGFFARYERGIQLLPKSFDVSAVHSGRQIEPELLAPVHSGEIVTARKLATTAASWCERYERWVVETEGVEYRRRSLNKWKHAVVAPGEMADAWRRVRSIYERWYRPADWHEALVPLTDLKRLPRLDLEGVSR